MLLLLHLHHRFFRRRCFFFVFSWGVLPPVQTRALPEIPSPAYPRRTLQVRAGVWAAGCLGFGLRWAAGADAGGGMESKNQFCLVGVAAPGPEFFGRPGGGPGLGPGSGGVLGFV